MVTGESFLLETWTLGVKSWCSLRTGTKPGRAASGVKFVPNQILCGNTLVNEGTAEMPLVVYESMDK